MLNSHFESTLLGQHVSIGAGLMVIMSIGPYDREQKGSSL